MAISPPPNPPDALPPDNLLRGAGLAGATSVAAITFAATRDQCRSLLSRNGTSPHRMLADKPGLTPWSFFFVSLVLGAAAGCGAYAFRLLIGLIHNVAFSGVLSPHYDTNVHAPPSPWGWGTVLVPVAGAILVVWLVKSFAPEAKGHGVPEVMDAIYYNKSVIRPVVAVVKSLASAISIGTGGSVGREGPIIQIGAAVASLVGRVGGASRWQRATLVAAGGGAGIAATFNTPIGGMLFAVEVLLHEVSVRTLVPVALTTATATYVGRSLLGNAPAFSVPELSRTVAGRAVTLPASVVLGALMALVSVVFIRSLYSAEDAFERRIPHRPYVRHALGMLLTGCIFQALFVWQGHYYVEGVGYAVVLDVLSGALGNPWLLIALACLKLLTTCLTLGSGGSGGIFSPCLFLGATLGAAYGLGLDALVPSASIDPTVCALVGMAALVAGTTGAALTSVVMIFEMTLDYTVILPLTLAAAVSYGTRRIMLSESIYTMKLARRGHVMPKALQANTHLIRHVAEIAMESATAVAASTRPDTLPLDGTSPQHFVVIDDNGIAGVVARDWSAKHPETLQKAETLAELAQRDFVVAAVDTTLFNLLAQMQQARASVAVVVPASDAGTVPGAHQRIVGVVTQAHLAEAMAEGLELFGD